MLRGILSFAALALLLSSFVQAQGVRSFYVEPPPQGPHYSLSQSGSLSYEIKTIEVALPPLKIKQTGLLTSRLSNKERERWKAIERFVFATGKDGTALHPVLSELWRWADESGHVIYVELPNDRLVQSSTAGSFNLEEFDATGRRHITVLKLFLAHIDAATSSAEVARASGFIPFSHLRKEERYAEVLGHELAHVKYVLQNALRTYLVHELIETTNHFLLFQARHKDSALASLEMRHRITQRDELLRQLEIQAEAVEEEVWREIISNQKTRAEMKHNRHLQSYKTFTFNSNIP